MNRKIASDSYQVFCPYEETRLAEAFGKEYSSYQENVRRWI